MTKIGVWNPRKFKVSCCGYVIYSRFPGEFRKCFCGNSAIDQTEYYSRFMGGRLEDFEEVLSDGEEDETGRLS